MSEEGNYTSRGDFLPYLEGKDEVSSKTPVLKREDAFLIKREFGGGGALSIRVNRRWSQ